MLLKDIAYPSFNEIDSVCLAVQMIVYAVVVEQTADVQLLHWAELTFEAGSQQHFWPKYTTPNWVICLFG